MRTKPGGDKAQVLRGHFMFRAFSEAELGALMAHAHVATFAAGEQIYLKGSPGTSMMAVLKGAVRISVPGPDGREIVLATIGEGDIVGEIALLDGKERTADVTAASDCEVLVIERRNFLPFMEQHPKVALRLLVALCARLRRTTEQVEDLALLNLPERLAKMLLSLAASKGERTPHGVRIAGRLMQGELGNMLGTSRESINKQLSHWQRAGILEISKGGIFTIRNEAALREIVNVE
jgi:CRP/FNR family transcriptional regulator, cyclic AMP receptor protein